MSSSQPYNSSRFWKHFLLCSLTLSLGILLVNYIVDPLGRNFSFIVPGVNRYKTEAVGFDRKLKPLRLKDVQPRTIIFGNSRAAYGINPASGSCFPQPVYNAAIEFCQFPEMKEILRYAINVAPIEKAVFLLDYNSSGPASDTGDFSPDSWHENGYRDTVKNFLLAYFSDNALKATFCTVLNNMIFSKTVKGETENGYVFYDKGYDFAALDRDTRLQRANQEASLEVEFQAGLREISTMVELCHSNGVDFMIVLAPFPPEHLSLRRSNGTYESVRAWKAEVGQLAPVLDYYRPDVGFTAADFYDRVHFKPSVGDLILADICRKTSWQLDNPSGPLQ